MKGKLILHLFPLISICFVSFCFILCYLVLFQFVSFRFDLFRFVSICFMSCRFVLFRFCFVSHFPETPKSSKWHLTSFGVLITAHVICLTVELPVDSDYRQLN